MKEILSIIKVLIVFVFVLIAIVFSFQGKTSGSLNGIIGGIALIQSFVIAQYELKK